MVTNQINSVNEVSNIYIINALIYHGSCYRYTLIYWIVASVEQVELANSKVLSSGSGAITKPTWEEGGWVERTVRVVAEQVCPQFVAHSINN